MPDFRRRIESRFQRLFVAIIEYLGCCPRLTVNSAFGASRTINQSFYDTGAVLSFDPPGIDSNSIRRAS